MRSPCAGAGPSAGRASRSVARASRGSRRSERRVSANETASEGSGGGETHDAALLLGRVVYGARRRVVLQERREDAAHRLALGALGVDDGRDAGDHCAKRRRRRCRSATAAREGSPTPGRGVGQRTGSVELAELAAHDRDDVDRRRLLHRLTDDKVALGRLEARVARDEELVRLELAQEPRPLKAGGAGGGWESAASLLNKRGAQRVGNGDARAA